MKPNDNHVLRIADKNLSYRDVHVAHPTPTGAHILEAAGASHSDTVLFQIRASGELIRVGPGDIPNLAVDLEFVVSEGSRPFPFAVDERQLEWTSRHISGAVMRTLADIADDVDLLCEIEGGEAIVIESTRLIDLEDECIKRIRTRRREWKLRVQGVTLTYDVPRVKVADAMRRAGFDPTKAWNIFLIVAGQPKKPIDVNYIVDLCTPGIEKIRLIPRNVDNGDGQQPELRREFDLLEVDEHYLNSTGLRWETTLSDSQRWLIINGYELPSGFTLAASTLALNVPKDYPTAQIDMFYFAPAVSRCDGKAIPNTEATASIDGLTFQRWSRHRNSLNPWDPQTDNVASHLALVEYSLVREFGE
ncbi:E2/UBC family protein [Trinickia sp. NRRL B-1857]|uniref:E2/UBC family protein n=1 Tax=Trinickia sp. NRRL B-1857 TaxID=3162879 RepID=UPI003D2D8980